MNRPQWIDDAANQRANDAARTVDNTPRAAVPLTLAAALGPGGVLLVALAIFNPYSMAAGIGGYIGVIAIVTALIALPIGVHRLAASVDRMASEHGSDR